MLKLRQCCFLVALLPAALAGAQQQSLAASSPAALPPLPSAFDSSVQAAMPLTAEEIRQLRRRLTDTKRAASEPSMAPPRPVLSGATIDLSPGAVPPAVRVSAGSGATISFFDSTGAAWPIQAHTNFNDMDFTVKQPVKESGSSLTVSANAEFGTGNLAVFLVGITTPVTMTLIAGRSRDTDYRFDARVPLPGPNATPAPVPVDHKPRFSQYLSEILDGVPPANARRLVVTGADVQGWAIGEILVLRTRLTLLSPKPEGRVVSADRTYVYEVPFTPSLLVSGEDGVVRQVTVGD